MRNLMYKSGGQVELDPDATLLLIRIYVIYAVRNRSNISMAELVKNAGWLQFLNQFILAIPAINSLLKESSTLF